MSTNEEVEEIYLERERFLLSTDEMLEQILEDNDYITYNIPINQENIPINQENDIRIETNIPLFASNYEPLV